MKTEHCPTCGALCKIVGDVTMHYEPVGSFDLPKALAERDQEWRDKIEEKIKEYEGEIKRPMTDDIKTLYKYQIQALTELLEEK